jgi:hypothetical protein
MVAMGLVTGQDISRAISPLEDPTLIWAMPMMVSAFTAVMPSAMTVVPRC